MAVIIAPFLFWGEPIERLAPAMLAGAHTEWLVVGLGAVLLMVDVALPIPSSVISVMLCVLAGPMLGAAAIGIGMLGAFMCGYVLGRLLPREALRRWVGPALWDGVGRRAMRSGAIWIMISRPVPVLAEATAIISGSLGVPFRSALSAALVSSAGVAACYGVAASIGLADGGFELAFALSAVLAALPWFMSRLWRGRMNA
jgi:uncharacterized membrane protein YdjX (TVP38/TMEM64 family)